MADMGMLSFQTPEEVALARKAAEDARNMQMSQMGLGQSARYGMLSAGSALGNAVGAATGYVDPNEARAQKTQQVMSSPDSDLNTSKGMLAKAAELRTIDPRLSMQLLLKGRELGKQEQAAVLAGRKQDTLDAAQLSLTKLQAAQAEKALRENPNLKEVEVGVAGKPDYRQKMIIDTRDPKAKPVLVGEPYQIAAGVRVDARSGGGSGGKVKPKGLSPEASLKWDFDNGLLDEETYKMAIAGRPGSKVMAAADTDRKKTEGFLAAAGYNPDTGSDKVEELIKKSTSGGLETGAAALAAFFGASTEGRVAINTLSAASNTITMEMMGGKLGAGVSNADRDFIVGQLGDVSNSNKPIPERLAAWKFAKDRMISVGLLKPKSGATKVPNRIKFDAQGNMVK